MLTSSSTCCRGRSYIRRFAARTPRRSASHRDESCRFPPNASESWRAGYADRWTENGSAPRRRSYPSAAGGRSIGRLLRRSPTYPHASLRLDSPLVELVTSSEGVVGAVRGGAWPSPRNPRPRRCAARGVVSRTIRDCASDSAYPVTLGTMGAPGNTGLALQAGMAAGRASPTDGPGVVVARAHPSRWALSLLAVGSRAEYLSIRTASGS